MSATKLYQCQLCHKKTFEPLYDTWFPPLKACLTCVKEMHESCEEGWRAAKAERAKAPA